MDSTSVEFDGGGRAPSFWPPSYRPEHRRETEKRNNASMQRSETKRYMHAGDFSSLQVITSGFLSTISYIVSHKLSGIQKLQIRRLSLKVDCPILKIWKL